MALIRLAPLTTWLLVSTYPSGVITKPEPLPDGCPGGRLGPRCGRRPAVSGPPSSPCPSTSIFTTDGLTSAATVVTVCE